MYSISIFKKPENIDKDNVKELFYLNIKDEKMVLYFMSKIVEAMSEYLENE